MLKKIEYYRKNSEDYRKRVDALESLIIRNNINVDLLANRDSLKTILLMFSVNLNVTKIEEIKKMLELIVVLKNLPN